jgi:peptide/nickel transport system substrate-binding protein
MSRRRSEFLNAATQRALLGAMVAVSLFAGAPGCSRSRDHGRIALVIESPPLTLDPRGAFNADTAHVQQLIFNTLVTKGPDFDFAPDLAESWEIAPDFSSYTFTLREGVRFHNGAPLGARDVVFTFESLLSGSFAKTASFHMLARVEAVDARTVRFQCREAYTGLLVDLIAVGILPEGSAEDAGRTPVGTGPYRVEFNGGDGDLRLGAFPGYFGGPPRFAGIDVRVIGDPAARLAALEAGEVDVAINPGLAPEALDRLGAEGATTQVECSPGGGIQFVVFNTERPELADARVRRALGTAVDREQITGAVLGGRARVAVSPLPPGHWAATDADVPPHSLGEASALLAESRRGAAPLRIDLMVQPAGLDRAVASVIQESWRQAGVAARIETVEPAVFFERLRTGAFAAALHRFTGGNQFTTIFKGAFHSRAIHRRGGTGGELNYARFASPELDQLIDSADACRDRFEQRRLYGLVQERIVAEAPWVLLWHADNVVVSGPRAGPVTVNRGGDFYCLRTP